MTVQDKILAFIQENDAQSVISAYPPREIHWYAYKEPGLVERFINKIKQYRPIFTRFEKYENPYLPFLSFAAS